MAIQLLSRAARLAMKLAAVVVLVGSTHDARAQTPADLRELALAIEHHDTGTARALARGIAPSSPARLRDALHCFELVFAHAALAAAAAPGEPTPSLDVAVRRLTTLEAESAAWLQAAEHCSRESTIHLENTMDFERLRVRLLYLRPELEEASRLAREALEGSAVDTASVLADEADRLGEAVELSPEHTNPWPFVDTTWRALDAPEAVPSEWPARSSGPSIASVVLGLLSGAVAVFGSLPSLARGRRVPPGIAGAYGLSLGGLASGLAGAGWQLRRRGIPIAGAILTTLTGLAGLLCVALLPEARGRTFGGGLLLGAGIGASWTIGGFAHLRHHRDADDAWREFLRALR